jgi:hypothetical protein
LSLLTVLTLLGSSVSAWAAAGVSGDVTCCCPVKTKCHCHDHDGQPDHTAKLKRCGGEATFTPVDVVPAVVPEIAVAFDVEVTKVEVVQTVRIPDDWSSEPEKPPI